MNYQIKNILIAPLAIMALSACVHTDGYNQLGYNDNQYCDPYNQVDAYYDCDLEYGFANFGYDGGWHQDYYYPGFGFFIFDSAGHRYRMNDYYLGYWGRKRRHYFQSRFAKRQYSGYRVRSFPWSERNGKRYVRSNEYRSNRSDRRNDYYDDHSSDIKDRRAGNSADRRQTRRDRRADDIERSERRERRSERRQTRRSNNNASNRGRNAEARNRADTPPPSARTRQNRQTQARPPRAGNNEQSRRAPRTRPPNARPPNARPQRTTAPARPRSNQRPSVAERPRETHIIIPKDD